MNKKINNKISVIILTHNEEIHIERVLKNIKKISDQIFIVDSFSNDKTIAIAKKNGAKIYKNKFINYSKQFPLEQINAALQYLIDNKKENGGPKPSIFHNSKKTSAQHRGEIC